MTSQNPPYPNFTGITYNSSFFSTGSTSLTQAVANTLYLRKKVADTATALETFNNGLIASNITCNGTITSTNFDIGFGDTNLALGTSVGVGTINIGASQSTGVLNIGTGGRSIGGLGGGINIGTSSSAPISIGSSVNTTTIGGALSIVGGIITNGFKYINTTTIPLVNDAGSYSAWNLSGSQGEYNIISLSQGSGGGVSFYDRMTNPSLGGLNYLGGFFGASPGLSATGILYAGTASITNGLTVGGPITLNYTTTPTSGQLGFQVGMASITTTIGAGATVATASVSIPSAGTWFIQANATWQSIAGYVSTSISSSSTVSNTACQQQVSAIGNCNTYQNLSCCVHTTGAQVYYILNSSNVAQTMQFLFIQATRIA